MKTIMYAVFIVLMAGCSVSNNMNGKKKYYFLEEQQLQELSKKIDSLDYERIAKAASGKLDETTDSVKKVYIQRLKDSVKARLNYFRAIENNPKKLKNKKESLDYLTLAKQNYSKELNNILFLDDLFKSSSFNRLNTAAFFGPGEYKLTDSAVAQASLIMQNIIQDAFNFSVKLPDRKLKAMFMVLGYADEQDISKGSDLYNELAPATGTKIPERKQLNTELSNRRASSIKNILKNKYRVIFPAKEGYLFSSSFMATGKGEELPAGNFKDYQPFDERRRVVLLLLEHFARFTLNPPPIT